MKASDITNEDIFIKHMNRWVEHVPCSGVVELCGTVRCRGLPGKHSCESCLGSYNINKLKEINSDINKDNLKESLTIARMLDI